MKKLTLLTAVVSITSVSMTPALAWAEYERSNHFSDWAKVTDVEPLYETVYKTIPVEQCWNERVRKPVRHHRHHGRTHDSATPTLIGALIGGAIGNELGHGKRNKQVGAVIGGIIGGSIGHDVGHDLQRERRASSDYYDDRASYHHAKYRTVERCEVREEHREEQVFAGYRVTYRYRGHLHSFVSDEKPGNRVRVNVTVSPS